MATISSSSYHPPARYPDSRKDTPDSGQSAPPADPKSAKTARPANPVNSASPIKNAQVKAYGSRYGMNVAEAIENRADESEGIKELGMLLGARSMAHSNPEFGRNVDMKRLNSEIGSVSRSPEVATMLEGQRLRTLGQTFGSQAARADLARRELSFLKSDLFKEGLAASRPQDRPQLVQDELNKLALVGTPQQLQEATRHLFSEAAQDGLMGLKNAVEGIKGGTQSLGALAEAAASIKGWKSWTGPPANAREQMRRALEERFQTAMAGDKSKYKNAIDVLGRLSEGRLGKVLTGLGIASQVASPLAQQKGLDWNAASSALSSAGGLGNLMNAASDASKMAKLARAAKFLGPAGDLVGAIGSQQKALDDLKNGDFDGAALKGTSAAFATVAGGLGLAMAAGLFTGPIFPAVAAGAGLVALGAGLIDMARGDTSMEYMLRNIDAWKPPVTPPQDPMIWKGYKEIPQM